MAGLERAKANGHDLCRIVSVASFFVSRVDTEVDKRLDRIGSPTRPRRCGARRPSPTPSSPTSSTSRSLDTDRWRALAAAGARPQRPLWASTSTKNPDYRDVMYVEELVAPDTVNTMPEATLHAFADHGEVKAGVVQRSYAQAQQVLDELAALGIGYDDVDRDPRAARAWRSSRRPGWSCSRASSSSWGPRGESRP